MPKTLTAYDYAVHSDFLIHWTGKDIDEKHQPDWYDSGHRSQTNEVVNDLYLQRLRNILCYGLWMTEDSAQQFLVGSKSITIPATPQCCFTELKLSESRRHGAMYGRLGIGVKRPFLFQRYGRPLAYFGYGRAVQRDKFLEACLREIKNPSLLNFFKPMNSDPTRLTYELYAESEWRILFFEELLAQRKIIDPRDSANTKEHEYFRGLSSEQQSKLKYLIPLNGWFAMLIYPSLTIKNHAQWDAKNGVADQIRKIKSDPNDHGNRVEGLKDPVRGNWPIEVDSDSCRNF